MIENKVEIKPKQCKNFISLTEDGEVCTKIYNTRAEPFYFSLKKLGFLIADGRLPKIVFATVFWQIF